MVADSHVAHKVPEPIMHSVNTRWNRPLSFVSVNFPLERVTTLNADTFGHIRCRNGKRGPKTEVNCMKIVFIPTSSLSFITHCTRPIVHRIAAQLVLQFKTVREPATSRCYPLERIRAVRDRSEIPRRPMQRSLARLRK